MAERICTVCGKSFQTSGNQKVCSKKCWRIRRASLCRIAYYKKLGKDVPEEKRNYARAEKKISLESATCFCCWKKFKRTFPNEKFCSDECRLKYFKMGDI